MQLNNCSEWALCSVRMPLLFLWCIILKNKNRWPGNEAMWMQCGQLWFVQVTSYKDHRLTGVQVTYTYHSEYTAWLLDAECLHYLEHIHNALCLATLNSIDEWTEHPTPTHCITVCVRVCSVFVCACVGVCVHVCVCVCVGVCDGRRGLNWISLDI